MSSIIEKIIIWLSHSKAIAWPRKIVWQAINKFIASKDGVVIYYRTPDRSGALGLIKEIKTEVKMLLPDNEAYQVFMLTKRTDKIQGDIAEVGVYWGGSAKLICEAKGGKALHLFDTFSGLPSLSEKDDRNQFQQGDFAAPFKEVKNYLKHYPQVYFYQGLFPLTVSAVVDKRFSFVHIDVDIYQSTLDCLEFFYPRMTSGGIILVHDFLSSSGVREVLTEFFEDKPEVIIELTGNQCLIVKH